MPANISKGCWTCRDRKVRCDQGLPYCRTCIQSSRRCKGYGLRLSWPRTAENRRAFIGGSTLVHNRYRNVRFLNATAMDLALHYAMSNERNDALASFLAEQPIALPRSLSWRPARLNAGEGDLISYFQSVVIKVFGFHHNWGGGYTSLLLGMAFTDSSTPSIAVLYSILALASTHLHGQRQSIGLKSKALRELNMSAKAELTFKDGLQLIASTMLLGVSEIFDATATSSFWAPYICSAKSLVSQVYVRDREYSGDPAMLLDWVYYHDILAKFTVKHWKQSNEDHLKCARDYSFGSKSPLSPERYYISGVPGCSLELLDIIGQATEAVLDSDDPLYLSPSHKKGLRTLELRLDTLAQVPKPHEGEVFEGIAEDITLIAELNRLAAKIYLYRVAMNLPSTSPQVETTLSTAFNLMIKMGCCQRLWPFFIIACEARTEERRRIVIRLFEATQFNRTAANFAWIQSIVETAWIQDDLYEGPGELNGEKKLSAAVSTCGGIPTFV